MVGLGVLLLGFFRVTGWIGIVLLLGELLNYSGDGLWHSPVYAAIYLHNVYVTHRRKPSMPVLSQSCSPS